MKAFIFVTILACALAEPDHHLYNAAHHTNGFRHYPVSGAVVPEDTNSVKVAKYQHLTAKANAEAFKGLTYGLPVVQYPYQHQYQYVAQPQVVQYKAPEVVVKKVESVQKPVVPLVKTPVVYNVPQAVQYVQPSTYAVPQVTYPYTTATHAIYKREAEAEPEAAPESQVYQYQYQYPVTQYKYPVTQYTYPVTQYTYPNVAATSYVSPFVATNYQQATYVPGVYHTLAKREAEAEPEADAEAQYYYGRYSYGRPGYFGNYYRNNFYYGRPGFYGRYWY